LGKSKVFLGYDWLKLHSPHINWRTGTITFDNCPTKCTHDPMMRGTMEWHDIEPEDRIFLLDFESYDQERAFHICARGTLATELAIQNKTPDQTFEELVPEHYHEYRDIFEKKDFDKLPPRRPWDHVIELKEGAAPTNCKLYPLSRDEQHELDEFLEEQPRSGRIRVSKSPWASPFFFVKKKDGKLRPVQDYRKLNEQTIKNKFPLPLIPELVDKLTGANYFTKMDIRWGYNNIHMAEGSEEKAAFLTNRGLFEPLVMFFGLCNSPATFQTAMESIFQDLIRQGVVIVYMDDILVYTKDLEEHRKVVREVLQRMREHQFFLKPEKCEFEQQRIEYLGLIITPGHIDMDPKKFSGITEWGTPKSKRDV